jgi:hypothetical protein
MTEVVEHRRESFFSVTDDPTLVVQANDASKNRDTVDA